MIKYKVTYLDRLGKIIEITSGTASDAGNWTWFTNNIASVRIEWEVENGNDSQYESGINQT